MKRKTLKKALAGISAVAMLGTALPTSLLASAVSYNGVKGDLNTGNGSDYGYGYLYDSIRSEKNDNDKKSPLVYSKTLSQMDATTLKDFTFMLKKYEVKDSNLEDIQEATRPVTGAPDNTVHGYVAKEWNIAQAKEDVKTLLNGKDGKGDVLDVTFYDNADDEQYGSDAYGEKNNIETGDDFIENRYGKIKSITLNMPVNKGNGGAGDITYEPVEFTVARTARDVKESTSGAGTRRGLILVNNIDLEYGTEGTNVNGNTTETARLNAALTAYKDALLASAKADIIKVIDEKIAIKANNINKDAVVAQGATGNIAGLVDALSTTDFDNAASTTPKGKVIAALLGIITNDSKGIKKWAGDLTTSATSTERAIYYDMIAKIDALTVTNVATAGDGGNATLWYGDSNSIIGSTDATTDDPTWKTNYAKKGIPLDSSNTTKKQMLYDYDVDLFLNGFNLSTPMGIQMNGTKLRVWGTNQEQVDYVDSAGTDVTGTPGKNSNAKNAITSSATGTNATLTAFGGTIELYDDVYVENLKSSSSTKPVIEGNGGKLIICGDAVVLKHADTSDGVVIKSTDTAKLDFELGDYTYYKYNSGTYKNNSFTATDKLDNKSAIMAEPAIYTYKNHMYNKYGLEVNTRPEDATTSAGKKLIADSTDYTDTNARTPEIDYGFQPAYQNDDYDKSQTNGSGAFIADNTNNISYDYTPEPDDYATASQYVNTAKDADTLNTDQSASGTPVIYVTNLGQLMWLNDNLTTLASGTNVTNGITVKIDPKTDNLGKLTDTNVIDFDAAPKSLVWDPVDASAVTNKITIDGKSTGVTQTADGKTAYTTDKYAVIKNMRIASTTGNAGIFAETKQATGVEVKNIGFEKPVVAASKSGAFAGVIAGAAKNIKIDTVYVAEPNISASNTAAFAGSFDKGSEIKNTFSYGPYDPVFSFQDDASRNLLVSSNQRQSNWYTNIYATDYPNKNFRGTTATYFKGATVEDFNSGKVAFMLNKHDPAMEIEASKTVPIEWDNGKNAAASALQDKSSVDNWGPFNKTNKDGTVTPFGSLIPAKTSETWYNGTYAADIFGQALGSNKSAYPTFLVGGNKSTLTVDNDTYAIGNSATNRVFRQITMECSGQREDWTADNAVFSNTEVLPLGGHEDTTKNGRCDNCGAYEIENTKNFDPVLWPGLHETAKDRGIESDFITLAKIGDMTSVTFDLRANMTTSKKTISDIMNIVLKQKSNGTHDLTGFDLLNKSYASGTELSATNPKYITKINFNVDDKIACTLTGDDYVTKGFEVFSMPYTGADLFASITNTTGINSSMAVVASGDGQKVKGADVHYYVAADKVTSGGTDTRRSKTATFKLHTNDGTNTVSKIDGLPTGYKAQQVYTFEINFSGLEHYGSSTFKNGLYNDNIFKAGAVDVTNQNTVGTDIFTSGEKIRDKKPAAYHTEVGINNTCGCIIAEAEHHSDFAITNHGHYGKCSDNCGYITDTGAEWDVTSGTGNSEITTGNKYKPHEMQEVYTFGNMVFERCQICGYSTFKKEAVVIAKSQAPELSIVVDDTGKSLYRQTYQFDVTAGDDTIVNYGVVYRTDGKSMDSITEASLKAMLDDNHSLDAEKMSEAGLSFTRKTAIQASGTYTVNKSLASEKTVYSAIGYLVYNPKGSSNYEVKKTTVLSTSFYDAADKEVQDSCAIETTVIPKKTSAGADYDEFNYRMELSNGCQAKEVANIYSKVNGYSVTGNTKIDSVDGKNINAKVMTNDKPNAVIVNLKHGVTRVAGVKTTAKGYMVVTNEKYGDLTFDVYSDPVTQAD